MKELLRAPLFWGALMALIGVLVGHWATRRSKSEAHDLAAIQVTVSILSAEVERLSGEVKEIREKWEKSEKRYRLLVEKYSAALAYIHSLTTAARGLFARLDAEDIPHGQIPPAPDLITSDI